MRYLFFAAILFGPLQSGAQSSPSVPARLESVIVYRAGAEMNHAAKLQLPAGVSQVVLHGVANALDESSLQIGAGAKVTVMSASFARNFLGEVTKSPARLKLEDSLQSARRDLAKIRNQRVTEEGAIELLDKNRELRTGNQPVTVAELLKLTEFYKSKQLELRNNVTALEEKEKLQDVLVKRLEKQVAELEARPETAGGQLVLQLLSEQAGAADISVRYMTPNAHWVPYYDLRAESVKDPLQLAYKAGVIQGTGIDWKKVKLTLSTANPSQSGTAPVLSAWFLRYVEPVLREYEEIARRQDARSNAVQSFGVAAKAAPLPPMKDIAVIDEHQLNATFDISIPYDIASDNKRHSVTLTGYELPAQYKYYAVPRLDPDAYLLAEVTDYEKLGLLPGEANIIFENMYAGKTYIQPAATTDTLNLTVGRDKRVVVKRERVAEQSGTRSLGSQKKQTFTYELKVRNGKKEAIQLLLKDQFPVSTDRSIEVELLESASAAVNNETGVLTWKLDLKPGETKNIRISYSVKYPKDKVLANL
ncbi:DUF4139 domain-containing protein [Chitinophaga lutea]